MTAGLGWGIWTAAVGLTLTVAPGCGRAERSQGTRAAATTPVPNEPRLEGVAGTMGTDPALMIVVRPATGEPVRVDGPLAADVGRLTGATVALFGTVQATAPWRTIEPTRYEVLEIDGQKPHVGFLRVEREEVWLESRPPLRLEGTPDALRVQHGAKVYVLGPALNGVLTVQSFGVIRAPD